MRRKTVGTAVAVALGLATAAAPGGFASGPATADDIALEHVSSALGLAAGDVDELEITDSYLSAHNGVTHVYVRQQHRGLDVLDAVATINVGRNSDVVHTGSRLLSDLDRVATGSVRLDASAAFAAAASALELPAPIGVQVVQAASGADSSTVLSNGGVAARDVRAHLAYQALEDGTARLAWVLDIELPSADHWYIASVDAETGELLSSADLVVSEKAEHTHDALARPEKRIKKDRGVAAIESPFVQDGSSYEVFALPLESPNDGPRTVVTDPADAEHSPHGWHDLDGRPGSDTTITNGNNVHAYADTGDLGVSYAPVSAPEYDNDAPDPDPDAQPDGGKSLSFRAPFTPNDPTALQNRRAAVINLFYWNNTIHDVLARYGFDEPAGNFQVNNYSGQGLGDDSVKAQAQDGGGPNNANFGTPPEGQRPRMQMFLWDPTVTALIGSPAPADRVGRLASDGKPQLIDGDFDSGVIAHEYGHGVSNRLTGGPSNVTCLRTNEVQEQMGEGWSDYFGVSLTMREGDDGATPRGLGNYVIYKDSREGNGIRPFPYSTDKTVNPATYDFVKKAAAPHGVGFVWNTMLYDMYWNLVAKHGFNADVRGDWTTGGNNLANQLVMDGMKMQPCKPGFEDGRDAILAADKALTGGANSCEIWRAFAGRGLGVDSTQGSSASKTDGFEGFELPSECV